MLENIKTEIIYYNAPKDFELEFNLGGCCNMRLLTCSENDENKLLSLMARAFSRNKIVIVTGTLTDDIIEKIALAIGYSTDSRNTDELYKTEDFSKVISGSVPLITENAVLGGCLVECGPQSLILLSSKKEIQREIMKTLIHPYIHALGELEKIHNEVNPEQHKTSDDTLKANDTQEIIDTPNDLPADNIEQNDDNKLSYLNDNIIVSTSSVNNKKLTIATLIIMCLILLVLGLLVYFLIILPILNEIPIIDNFNSIFGFLFNYNS